MTDDQAIYYRCAIGVETALNAISDTISRLQGRLCAGRLISAHNGLLDALRELQSAARGSILPVPAVFTESPDF